MKAFLQKKFQVQEKIPLSAFAFGCSHALVAEGFNIRSRRPHSSLISGLLGLEGTSKRKDSRCRSGQAADWLQSRTRTSGRQAGGGGGLGGPI